jgi:hypothetical protein
MVALMLVALWISVAILAGGHARTRGRSAWSWFVYTLVLGPIAVYVLVVWPPLECELSTDRRQAIS